MAGQKIPSSKELERAFRSQDEHAAVAAIEKIRREDPGRLIHALIMMAEIATSHSLRVQAVDRLGMIGQLASHLPLTMALLHLGMTGQPEEVRKAAYDALCLPSLASREESGAAVTPANSEQRPTWLGKVPERFGTFLGVEGDPPAVQIRLEGKKTKTVSWPIRPDSQIIVNCCPGTLEQFRPGDRVWASRASKRRDLPAGVKLLTDEVTTQSNLYQVPIVQEIDLKRQSLVVTTSEETPRTLRLSGSWRLKPAVMMYRIVQPDGESHCLLRPGERLYLQTAGDEIRRLLARDQLRQIERAYRAEVER